jgi:hypothetical protein
MMQVRAVCRSCGTFEYVNGHLPHECEKCGCPFFWYARYEHTITAQTLSQSDLEFLKVNRIAPS